MSVYVNTFGTTSLGLNKNGYLDISSSNLYLNSQNITESFFGISNNDIFHVIAYDSSSNVLFYSEEHPNKQFSKIEYTYVDVDNNTFDYYYNKSIPYIIKNPQGDSIFDVGGFIRDNKLSGSFDLVINPVTNVFTYDDSLIVTSIGSSRKEVKLSPSFFNYIPVDQIIECAFSGSNILINNTSSLDVLSGITYTVNCPQGVDDLFISKNNNGIPYNKGIVFQKSKKQIIIDFTEFPLTQTLWICDKTKRYESAKLILSGTVSPKDYISNVEFLTLDSKTFAVKQIYDLITHRMSLFNVYELYNVFSQNYQSFIDDIKVSLNLSSNSQIVEAISSLYYGLSTFDYQLNQNKTLTGIFSYIINYLNFNYDVNGNFDELLSDIKHIVSQCVEKYIEFKTRGNRITKEETNTSIFFNSLFNYFFTNIIQSVYTDYSLKFKTPLNSALNFGNGRIYQIINSRIDYVNGEPVYVVKLTESLEDDISEKTICKNVINISIEPTYQNITCLPQKKEIKKIVLTSTNFSVSEDGNPSISKKKTPMFTSDMLAVTSTTSSLIDTTIKSQTFNIDFTDFNNFVVFSSANLRVKIFENKLITLSNLYTERNTILSSSVYDTTRDNRLSAIDNNILSTIKSFDFYESYLYNTGEFNYDSVSKMFVEYNGVTWKQSSYVLDLEAKARAYDKQNLDSLVNNTPQYIHDSNDSTREKQTSDKKIENYDDYLKFLCMIGHYFDNLYLYISNFQFYKKIDGDSVSETPKNILNHVLNSFGIDVPPCVSTGADDSTIEEYRLSTTEIESLRNSISLDAKTKEIWKRMLDNLPYLYKSKGTMECLRYIFLIYGIPENLLNIREFGGGYYDSNIQSKNIKSEYIFAPEFIGTDGEVISIEDISGHESVDFKLYIDSKKYADKNKLIIPIYNRYNDSVYHGQQHFFSFGLIKEHDNIGRMYFLIKDNHINPTDVLYRYVSEPLMLFNDDMYSVMIRKGETIDTSFVKYDILIGNMSTIPAGETYKTYTLYLPLSASIISSVESNDFWGNSTFLQPSSSLSASVPLYYSQSIDVASSLRGMSMSTDDSDETFKHTGNISDTINYTFITSSFYGCIDKITYQLTTSSNDTFLNKCYNYNYYCDGRVEDTAENIYYRFNFYPPIDISVSSSVGKGYQIGNFNGNYSNVNGYMKNFSGSNYVNVWNTSSCSYDIECVFPYQCKKFYLSNTYFTNEVGPDREENDKIDSVDLVNTTNTVYVNKKFSQKSKKDYYVDSNKLGIFLNPLLERNEDILDFFGTSDIISSISRPAFIYSGSYKSLETLRRNFYSMPVDKILFNELFTVYKVYVDKSIFDTFKFFLPVRNKVYTGILIEPTILERPKIESKPLLVENVSLGESVVEPIKDVSAQILTSSNVYAQFEFTSSNHTYPFSNFEGFYAINDTPDEYQLKLFINPVGLTEYNNNYYNVYVDAEPKTMYNQIGDNISGTVCKKFNKLILISGSVSVTTSSTDSNPYKFYMSDRYTKVTGKNYYNNLSFKPLSFRKETYLMSGSVSNNPVYFIKSRQTNNTTISNDSMITDTNPVISITVGNVIKS